MFQTGPEWNNKTAREGKEEDNGEDEDEEKKNREPSISRTNADSAPHLDIVMLPLPK